MSGFFVDARSLLAVRSTLGRLHTQLLDMHTAIWGFWGELGGRALEGELEHFCGTWHYGVTEVAAEVDDLMGRLVGAAVAYERIERRIAASSASGSGTTTIGGASPPPLTGSGTTMIGGAPPHPNPKPPTAHPKDAGTTTID
ncbi:MAG: hypothetical protein ACRDMX_18105 [Solirubrobacteraceae bacterium]